MFAQACLLILGIPLAAQVTTTITLNASSLKKVDLPHATGSRPAAMPDASTGTVSAELLRQPLPPKARQMLLKAQHASTTGNHAAAVRLYVAALAKYPDSAAWTQSLLGVEYLKLDQYQAAVTSFDQAALLLPHSAMSRSNLGLSLILAGQYSRAGRELRHALELDPGNTQAKQLWEALQHTRE